ncbi:MAG: universal stress protein [Myxococcales bacterium]|nr:universal stress protein [Myxococcales bacterium]
MQTASSEFADRNLLVPVDFSDLSRAALLEADALVRAGDGHMTVLHVLKLVRIGVVRIKTIDEPAQAVEELREAREKLEAFTAALGTARPRVQLDVVLGEPVEEIVKRSGNHDLIVLGTHGKGGIRRLVLGTVAEKVARGAQCSVLLVRERR